MDINPFCGSLSFQIKIHYSDTKPLILALIYYLINPYERSLDFLSPRFEKKRQPLILCNWLLKEAASFPGINRNLEKKQTRAILMNSTEFVFQIIFEAFTAFLSSTSLGQK